MGKYWTGYEFDGILNLETTTRKVFLPIWHNVTVDDVKAFSPSIAGRKAFETNRLLHTELQKTERNIGRK